MKIREIFTFFTFDPLATLIPTMPSAPQSPMTGMMAQSGQEPQHQPTYVYDQTQLQFAQSKFLIFFDFLYKTRGSFLWELQSHEKSQFRDSRKISGMKIQKKIFLN